MLADADPAKIRICLRWHSGASDEIINERVTSICEARRTAPEAVELVRRLGPTTENADLARQLNAAGHHTGTGRSFDTEAVRAVRRSYGIPAPGVLAPGETTAADIAAHLQVARSTIILWIEEGLLSARKTTHRYCVTFDAVAEAACRARIASSPWISQPDDAQPTPDDQTPAEVARYLGVTQDAIHNWI